MLQEGKGFNRIVFIRALHSIDVFNDIYAEGGGIKKLYSSFDAFLLRMSLIQQQEYGDI